MIQRPLAIAGGVIRRSPLSGVAVSSPADPPVQFSTFIISLASSALAHLGHVDDPGAHEVSADRELARQSIDLIEMLAEKTKGNLDPDEAHLLEAIRKELKEKFNAART